MSIRFESDKKERDGRKYMRGGGLTFGSVVDGNRLLLNRISDIELNDTSQSARRERSVREIQVSQSEKIGWNRKK